MSDCGPTGRQFESALSQSTLTMPSVVHDWVNKGLGRSSHVCVTGHVKDPVPLIEKSRASCPSGRFPPSFIHQVIIIIYDIHGHIHPKENNIYLLLITFKVVLKLRIWLRMLWPHAQDRVLKYVLKYVKKFRVTPRAQIEHGFAISSLSTR